MLAASSVGRKGLTHSLLYPAGQGVRPGDERTRLLPVPPRGAPGAGARGGAGRRRGEAQPQAGAGGAAAAGGGAGRGAGGIRVHLLFFEVPCIQ